MSARDYVQVNVYPTSTGWCLAVMQKRAGRPYPLTVQVHREGFPLSHGHDLFSALMAASRALCDLAEEHMD